MEFLRPYWPTPIRNSTRSTKRFIFHACFFSKFLLDKRLRKICYLLARDKNNLLPALRTIATLIYFLRMHVFLKHKRLAGLLVSSESNPEALGAAAAFARHSLPVVFINHGFLPDNPPKLDFSLAILDSPALAKVYTAKESLHFVFKGIEGSGSELKKIAEDRPIRVGVFSSLTVDWIALKRWLLALEKIPWISEVYLRKHPNPFVRNRNALSLLGLKKTVIAPIGSSLYADSKLCDFVIAGNSSVHLNILKCGTPTVFVDEIDTVPREFYSFQRNGIIPEYKNPEDLQVECLNKFYNMDWKQKFAPYDPYYGISEEEFSKIFSSNLKMALAKI
jgi:hypothetical protein